MNRAEIEARIPHAGDMCLLDTAVDWDNDRIHCRSDSHRRADNPLHRRHQLAAVHLVEYAAQAAALHSGLMAAGGDSGGGMLAGLREIRLNVADAGAVEADLDIHAGAELRSAQGLIYGFSIYGGAAELAGGRLTIIRHNTA